MSGLKEIRRRIGSIKNTKQITRAMKLVSAAKLRRAQEAAQGGRTFSSRLGEVLESVVAELPEGFSDPLIEPREHVKSRRIVVVAGERGLCGAYNTNVFKSVIAADVRGGDGASFDVVTLGKRAGSFAATQKWPIARRYEGLGEDAGRWPIDEIGDELVRGFLAGDCDEVVIHYTTFVSAMNQRVTREVLLPFSGALAEKPSAAQVTAGEEQPERLYHKFDPQPAEILSRLIPLLIKTRITQAALESKASEHAARMTAMDSATRNADELMERLRLYYNRARQSAITTELIDIVGGAEAQK